MSDTREMKQANRAYNTLCTMLDNRNWKYEKKEEDLKITCTAKGDDLPIDILIEIDVERSLICFYSYLGVKTSSDKRGKMALAVNMINSSIIDGSFDYNILNGNLLFRLTSSFKNSLISENAFEYIIYISCSTVDQYNDKLDSLAKGDYTIEELYKFINE